MSGNELNMKTSLYAKKRQFLSRIKKKAKSYTYAVFALTPSIVIEIQLEALDVTMSLAGLRQGFILFIPQSLDAILILYRTSEFLKMFS